MPKPILDCPRVVAVIRQLVAAGVAQHVDVHRERKAGALADALDKTVHRVGVKGRRARWQTQRRCRDTAAEARAGRAVRLHG
jgi:hypothetical protein